jgi:hypothetical protein
LRPAALLSGDDEVLCNTERRLNIEGRALAELER